MIALRHTRRLSIAAGLAILPVLAFAPSASAAHESSNLLDFDPVAGAAGTIPTADGGGRINYVKGASDGTEDGSVWQQSLRFTGLVAGTPYTVEVLKGDGAGDVVPGTAPRVICTFNASPTGAGSCTGRFLELRALAVAQLKTGGVVVAQATRTGAPNPTGGVFTEAAPGEITSNGGCREPEQGGSQCLVPGHI
jgi:hypothetical protein